MEHLNTKRALAERIAERLADVPDVVALVLGGSLARGRATPNSDADIGLYYYPARPPSITTLERVAAQLDDSGSGDTVSGLGGWGPWVNGGAWLTVEGHCVDWTYRDLDKVERVFIACERGEIARHIQPEHPHGFHTHIYLGEVHHSWPLFDPAGALTRLKARAERYPEQLAKVFD